MSYKSSSTSNPISPWHSIPMKSPGSPPDVFNMVLEIPRMTKAKMEISTTLPNNPIVQDKKKGKLRDYHGPIFWNYGAIPQTWEDPSVSHEELKVFGDNDPVDVVDISEIGDGEIGDVVQVKVLGCIAMIDDGELDWKVIAVNTADEKYKDVTDIDGVSNEVKQGIREWFRWYKTPDGKPLNSFGFDEKFLDKKYTMEVLEETNQYWKNIMEGKTDKGNIWTE